MRRRAGRCATHDDLAWQYDDDSIGCFYCSIVEVTNDDCVWVEMPENWVFPDARMRRYRRCQVTAETVRDAVNDALHRMFDGPPCETACIHRIAGNWTALGIANVFARRAAELEQSDGDPS